MGNEEGGADGRRMGPVGSLDFVFVPTYVVPDILVLLLLGTTVVAPLAALVIDTIEDVRGLVAPDDVPAAVELDVLRDTRDAASDGGLEGIRGEKDGKRNQDCGSKLVGLCARRRRRARRWSSVQNIRTEATPCVRT